MAEDKPTWNPQHLAIVVQGARALADLEAEGLSEPLRLSGANLSGADLSGAGLSNANLVGADLRNANLRHAILFCADLSGAFLKGLDLSGANLAGAVLAGADLRDTNLTAANLISANLRDTILKGLDLSGAVLSGADLRGADLRDTNLTGADLRNANLRHAILFGADLSGADLSGAVLAGADLRDTNLTSANLSSANLRDTILKGLDLSGANLSGAMFGDTSIETDLTGALGLEDVRHMSPSQVSHDVLLRKTQRPWPIQFLRGCGLSDFEIEHVRSVATTPIEFYSCFVSYSSKDDKFAVKLNDALQAKGIRCWLDKHELLPGDELQVEINKGIRLWDKVLLLCSEHSLTSPWVRKEIKRAIEKEDTLERERGKRTLAIIPLDLDGFLFDQKRCEFDWAADIRARHAAKFVGWDAPEGVFDEQFARVVKALRADDLARTKPPTPKQ